MSARLRAFARLGEGVFDLCVIGAGIVGSRVAYEAAKDGLRVALIEEINASGVQALFAANIGKQLTSQEIRAAFDMAFGPGTGVTRCGARPTRCWTRNTRAIPCRLDSITSTCWTSSVWSRTAAKFDWS